MPEGRHLRPVESEPGDGPAPERAGSRLDRRILHGLLLLLVLLGVGAGLLGWDRTRLAGRIEDLEAEIRHLRGEVELRDRLIELHEARLDEVRSGLDEVRALLDAPLTGAD